MAQLTKQQRIEQAGKALRDILKPGDTIYTVLMKASGTGSRQLLLFTIVEGNPVVITGLVARFGGYRTNRDCSALITTSYAGEVVAYIGTQVFPDADHPAFSHRELM